jgi:hypothetical protein
VKETAMTYDPTNLPWVPALTPWDPEVPLDPTLLAALLELSADLLGASFEALTVQAACEAHARAALLARGEGGK